VLRSHRPRRVGPKRGRTGREAWNTRAGSTCRLTGVIKPRLGGRDGADRLAAFPRLRQSLPEGKSRSVLFGFWLDEADREAIVQADSDVFGGEAMAARGLVRFLRESDGFRVEEVRPQAVPEPSRN